MHENVKPALREREVGSSMPMNKICPQASCVAVHITKAGLKFVHIEAKPIEQKFQVLLFMDNRLTDKEIIEWNDFSNNMDKFR